MKREVLIAIFFGLIVGLVLTVGMYRARTALESIPEETPRPVLTGNIMTEPTPAPINSSDIRLSVPGVDAVTDEPTTPITGTTYPESTIVILQNEKEILAMTDSLGNFSVPVTLEPGSNIFIIRVLSSTHPQQEIVRTVVYEPTKSVQSSSTSATLKPVSTPKP